MERHREEVTTRERRTEAWTHHSPLPSERTSPAENQTSDGELPELRANTPMLSGRPICGTRSRRPHELAALLHTVKIQGSKVREEGRDYDVNSSALLAH